jgi:hypothetical protein
VAFAAAAATAASFALLTSGLAKVVFSGAFGGILKPSGRFIILPPDPIKQVRGLTTEETEGVFGVSAVGVFGVSAEGVLDVSTEGVFDVSTASSFFLSLIILLSAIGVAILSVGVARVL